MNEEVLEYVGYGMYGKIYLCPSCGKKIYLKELHDSKCDYCLDPTIEYESLIKKERGKKVDKK